MTREEILNLWGDYDKCPDFKPILDKLLDELEKLRATDRKLLSAFAAGFFKSHCSHNGEMVDEIELKELNQTKEEYVQDMFEEWVKNEW